jgi:thiamine-phosphate pyrophosphorylase
MPDFKLCVVTDRKLAGDRELPDIVSESLAGGAGMIQLREKALSSREFFLLALEIKKLFKDYPDRLFIINDRVDIALASGADGVHLGRDDLPVLSARKILGPRAVIGASVSSAEEAERAFSEGASYVGAGAVFPTPTKPEAEAVGLSGLQDISSAGRLPVIAIGGINRNNAPEAVLAGASGIAVVSEVMASENPRLAVRELLEGVMSALSRQAG